VIVGVFVVVFVGVGVIEHSTYLNSSQPKESVITTKTGPFIEVTTEVGTCNSKIGGTETTPVATVSQYVLVLSHIVISYGDCPVKLVMYTTLI